MGSVDWYHESLRGIIGGVVGKFDAQIASSLEANLLTSRLLADAGFLHAFPERGATLAALASALGVAGGGASEGAGIVQVKQVHGGAVIEVAGEQATDALEGDALVARAGRRPVAVGIRVADCVPILVADATSGDVAAIHAGWRGVTLGVVAEAIARIGHHGHHGRLVAAIGPCIGGCCFEVGRDVAERIARAAGVEVVVSDRGEKVNVDLRAAVRAQLVAAGLSQANVDDVPGCTKHAALRFHSFRRDGAQSGRMLAAIATR